MNCYNESELKSLIKEFNFKLMNNFSTTIKLNSQYDTWKIAYFQDKNKLQLFHENKIHHKDGDYHLQQNFFATAGLLRKVFEFIRDHDKFVKENRVKGENI